jgi:hypothetical protein
VKPAGKSWVARAKPNDKHGDWLVIAGDASAAGAGRASTRPADDEPALSDAAIDLVLRYWTKAKDLRLPPHPLVDTPIEKGGDPKLLP